MNEKERVLALRLYHATTAGLVATDRYLDALIRLLGISDAQHKAKVIDIMESLLAGAEQTRAFREASK